jgi:putative oxidoreductase
MLNKFLQDNKGEFYFAFRLIVGVMFAMHGAEKLGLIGGGTVATGLMLVAGIIELVGGLAIVLGAYVEIVSVVAGLEMLYAFFTVHTKTGYNPLTNGGEVVLLYLAAFLVLATHGPGKWNAGNPGSK